MDVFNITPGDLPVLAGQSGYEQFVTGTEIEAGKYLTPRTFATVIAPPGALTKKAPPGATITHRTAKGYQFQASYSPRYILDAPTLSGQAATAIGQFGMFIIREWRF